MKGSNIVISSLEKINITEETACTIGNFDGIHSGHIGVLKLLKQVAAEQGLRSVVITFYPHPRKVLSPENFKCSIINLETKIYLLKQENIDYIVVINFNESFYKKSPKKFIDFLREKLLCRKIVIGKDWRFGYNKAGDVNFAASYGKEIGLDVIIADDVRSNGDRVSSSRIRELLRGGEVKSVRKLLGRNYFLREKVVRGNQIGREIGFPTINFKPEEELCLKRGVYAGFVELNDRKHPAVINFGYRPTVGGDVLILEAHVIDGFNANVEEGDFLNVYFIDYIREEIKFNGLDGLKHQIEIDILKAKEVIAGVGVSI